MTSLQNLRRNLTRQIKSKATRRFRDLGFNKHLDPKQGMFGPKRPLRGFECKRPIPLKFAGENQEVIAITEDGVMIDAYGGGCVTWGYGCLAVEDLARINHALARGAA